ncbi:MAG: stage II sporulation protein M [Candidatus Aenigmarchaeota archaeon]|nr:stage II sporulation protein M [Candidatus Aenigmarchaeota archaeon]
MVLESILNPKQAEDRPWEIFLVAFIYTLISVLFSVSIFPEQSSILSVAFLTIIFVPFFQKLFEIEEEKEDQAAERKMQGNLFARHQKLIYSFSAFFLGIIIAMSFLFIFYADAEPAFSLQTETLKSFSYITASTTENADFVRFLLNNTQVMVLMFVLSVAFGAGAVFILAWNASVIAVYVGLLIRSFIESGLSSPIAYLYGVPVGLGSIALHGIPEIVAYFIAGLAGGILSVGILREKAGSREFNKILFDSLVLLLAAEMLIVAAAYTEAVF